MPQKADVIAVATIIKKVKSTINNQIFLPVLKTLLFHLMQLHLQSKVQSRFALPQEQLAQLPLHVHLTSSLVHFPTSDIVIQHGVHFSSSLFHPKSEGEGKSSGSEDVIIQIPDLWFAKKLRPGYLLLLIFGNTSRFKKNL